MVVEWSLAVFLANPLIASITVVHNANDKYISPLVKRYPSVQFVAQGGASRAHSVLNGLNVVTDAANDITEDTWAVVHDAARCCLHPTDLAQLLNYVIKTQHGAILAAAAIDTIKIATSQSKHQDALPLIAATLDRNCVFMAQTPQVFRLTSLRKHLRAVNLASITDEASVMEQHEPVGIVTAQYPNFKVTYPPDLILAAAILNSYSNNT
jgi:2-C-methyl-D-erythritol 4-phosphate cytidylyltransferase